MLSSSKVSCISSLLKVEVPIPHGGGANCEIKGYTLAVRVVHEETVISGLNTELDRIKPVIIAQLKLIQVHSK